MLSIDALIDYNSLNEPNNHRFIDSNKNIHAYKRICNRFSMFYPAVHRPGEAEAAADASMGTQGTGRKRAPLKDRFSAEDEALSSIAREVSCSETSRFPLNPPCF